MEHIYAAEVKALRAELARLGAETPAVSLDYYAHDVEDVLRVLDERGARKSDTRALCNLIEAMMQENESLREELREAQTLADDGNEVTLLRDELYDANQTIRRLEIKIHDMMRAKK